MSNYKNCPKDYFADIAGILLILKTREITEAVELMKYMFSSLYSEHLCDN